MKNFPVGRLFFTSWLVYLFHFRHLAAGSDRFVLLVRAIVEQRTFRLDAYQTSPFFGDVVMSGGHYYSNINPGTAWLGVPFWAIANFFYQNIPPASPFRREEIHHFLAHFITTACTSSLLSALAGVFLGLWAYQRSKSQWRGILTVFLYNFCSIAFFYSTRLSQNILIASLSIFVFVLLFKPQILRIKSYKTQLFLIGFILAYGLVIDLTIVPLAGVVLILLFWQNRTYWLVLRYFLFGTIAPVLLLLLYQYLCFGNPFLSASNVFLAQEAIPEPSVSLALQIFQRSRSLFTYLFSPQAGLFIYMPYFTLAMVYLLHHNHQRLYFKHNEKRYIFGVFIAYSFFLLALPASYLQYTLFGCRYIIPLVPLLCLTFALHFRPPHYHLGIALIALGFLINLAGAQQGYDTDNIIIYTLIYIFRGAWFPLLDWLQTGLPEDFNTLPSVLNPSGIVFLLLLFLMVIWWSYFCPYPKSRE
ncbi:hypothetical protein K4A83_21390 [Spirulina subsalsa FACHB-351]|uniref:Glycosyltransferase RgtA/B/C/D-like domain-containing protein n=1 Tax=Spirulina subsalsa FACHB-351 TaxID=234711 RepID=A0ABT3LBC5_9CYAN|nr:hypothetical protein [Spirulina subsalsa]MCW6038803.1 hypothetical protein [Spirulina subsalsa FACHB-351]